MGYEEEQLALFEHWSEGIFDFSASEKNVILFAETFARQGLSVDSPEYYQERLHTLGELGDEDALEDIARNNKLRHHRILLKSPNTPDDLYFLWQINCHPTYRFVPKKLGHDNSTFDDQLVSAPQTAWHQPSQEQLPIGPSPLPQDSSQELLSTKPTPPLKTMER